MSHTRYAANREFDVFAAGALQDAAFIGSVAEWLSTSCGFRLAPPGDDPGNIANARNFVFAVSGAAIASTKLMELMHSALREIREHAGLRFIALVRDDVAGHELPQFIAEHGFVRTKGDRLTAHDAVIVLEAMYQVSPDLDLSGQAVKDVYFTHSWLEDTAENRPVDQVCARASKFGFRLIGDTEDPEFDPVVRLPEIMAGCGGFIAVLPYRAGPCGTSEWMLEELRLANAVNLPCLIVKDPRIALSEEVSGAPSVIGLVDHSTDTDWVVRLDAALRALDDRWRQPDISANVLYLTGGTERIDIIKALVSRITGMTLTTIDRPLPDRRALVELVRSAGIVLCDLLRTDAEGWIAAGCAIALDRKLEILIAESDGAGLLSAIPAHRYTSELDRLGQLHRILQRHRRKVMNSGRAGPTGETA